MLSNFVGSLSGGGHTLDNAWSALTTYGLALIGMLSTDNIVAILGAALLVVRLAYETVRLRRYLADKDADDDE